MVALLRKYSIVSRDIAGGFFHTIVEVAAHSVHLTVIKTSFSPTVLHGGKEIYAFDVNNVAAWVAWGRRQTLSLQTLGLPVKNRV